MGPIATLKGEVERKDSVMVLQQKEDNRARTSREKVEGSVADGEKLVERGREERSMPKRDRKPESTGSKDRRDAKSMQLSKESKD